MGRFLAQPREQLKELPKDLEGLWKKRLPTKNEGNYPTTIFVSKEETAQKEI